MHGKITNSEAALCRDTNTTQNSRNAASTELNSAERARFIPISPALLSTLPAPAAGTQHPPPCSEGAAGTAPAAPPPPGTPGPSRPRGPCPGPGPWPWLSPLLGVQLLLQPPPADESHGAARPPRRRRRRCRSRPGQAAPKGGGESRAGPAGRQGACPQLPSSSPSPSLSFLKTRAGLVFTAAGPEEQPASPARSRACARSGVGGNVLGLGLGLGLFLSMGLIQSRNASLVLLPGV